MARTSPNKLLNITDETLRNELVNRGQHVGPIVETTRLLYQKILIRLLKEEQQWSEDNNEEERQQIRFEDNQQMSGIRSAETQRSSSKQLSRISFINKKSLFFVAILLAIIFAYFFKYY